MFKEERLFVRFLPVQELVKSIPIVCEPIVTHDQPIDHSKIDIPLRRLNRVRRPTISNDYVGLFAGK